ncbi:hypothetical protein JVT61DRAFT_14778 [Boletus reticuloceps]|uniref:Uncharacterized protein n=1 Tax=Boletus reticuloceps TaxID=495285 RepID=A0A8I2YWE8_9AGAM|nr:hypothetical protein JVT61DRAFT_14623 [Boletus reticuloceps]KAG6377982.1 hypothetical protein JVT61DRAFT_14778 [Boletus reticuloceps]
MSRSPAPEIHAAMQRRIFALEEENAKLIGKMVRRPIQTYIREGRAIRRLVSLSDPVVDLIREYDRRVLLANGPNDIENANSTDKQERTYRSYKKLVEWCPSVTGLMQAHDSDELEHACGEVSIYHSS